MRPTQPRGRHRPSNDPLLFRFVYAFNADNFASGCLFSSLVLYAYHLPDLKLTILLVDFSELVYSWPLLRLDLTVKAYPPAVSHHRDGQLRNPVVRQEEDAAGGWNHRDWQAQSLRKIMQLLCYGRAFVFFVKQKLIIHKFDSCCGNPLELAPLAMKDILRSLVCSTSSSLFSRTKLQKRVRRWLHFYKANLKRAGTYLTDKMQKNWNS